ncbi:hypothetical protein HaLaN_22134, partial [Haematococcus lacustris]
MDGALPEMPEMVHGQGRPPGAHLPWGIRMERSDAAAWENEEQRSAGELHASEHVACSYGPSPMQQVQHHEGAGHRSPGACSMPVT